MNKIFSLSLALVVIAGTFTSCVQSEEDDIFDKSAAERLNEASGLYSGRLEDSKGGWVMEYYPTWNTDEPTGNGYILCALFNTDGSVKMGMNNTFSNNKYLEDTSAWDVITDDGPVLTFNTYNKVMHAFSNPEDLTQTSGDDETGKGALGDYEFVMVDVPEGGQHIMLKGKKRGTYTRMTRLPEGTDFDEYITDVEVFRKKMFSSKAPNYVQMVANGISYNVQVSTDASGIVEAWPSDGDKVLDIQSYVYLVTKRDNAYYLRFRSAFTSDSEDDEDETSVQEMKYDEDANKFVDENNAENYIGLPTGEAFTTMMFVALQNKGWTLTNTSEASDDAMAKIQAVYDGYKKKSSSNTFQSISFIISSTDTSEATLSLSYKQGRSSTKTVRYTYNCQQDGDKIILSYKEPVDNNASTALSIDGVQDLLDLFNGTILVSDPEVTGFTVDKVKFTNGSSWFVLK